MNRLLRQPGQVVYGCYTPYLIGVAGVHAAVGGVALVDAHQFSTLATNWHVRIWLVMSLIILPVAVHAFVAWLSGFVRPCRLMTPGCASLLRGAAGGFAAGMLAVLLVLVALVLLPQHRLDLLYTLASPVPATGLVLGLSQRVRPGHCRVCGYCITPSLDTGRCPECGTFI